MFFSVSTTLPTSIIDAYITHRFLLTAQLEPPCCTTTVYGFLGVYAAFRSVDPKDRCIR
jgi:hypothetical protein